MTAEDKEAQGEEMLQEYRRVFIVRCIFSRTRYRLLISSIIEFCTSGKDKMSTPPMRTAGGLQLRYACVCTLAVLQHTCACIVFSFLATSNDTASLVACTQNV